MTLELVGYEKFDILRLDISEIEGVSVQTKVLVESCCGIDVSPNRSRAFVFGFQVPLERIDVDQQVAILFNRLLVGYG